MPAPFTAKEKLQLYQEISKKLGMSESGVYGRMKLLDIPIQPWRKGKFLNKNAAVKIPFYSKNLIQRLFAVKAKSLVRERDNTIHCYVGSVDIVRFLRKMGLVENKVKMQVAIPLSFKNYSLPLLEGVRDILMYNNFKPSRISSNTVYLTKRTEVERYFRGIRTSNPKHLYRLGKI